MRLTILFFCIASLTLALALPTWRQVAQVPQTLSSSLRARASAALDLGEQALLHSRAFLPRRGDIGYTSTCREPWFDISGCPDTPEDEMDLEGSFIDSSFPSSFEYPSPAR